MRPRDRVLRTRRVLAAAVATRAVLWSAAVGLVAAALTTVVAGRLGGAAATWVAVAVAAILALGLAGASVRRLTVPRVALWIEERVPQLGYALVTAVDPRYEQSHVAPELARRIERVSWSSVTSRAVLRALVRPAVGAAVALVALVAVRRADLGAAPATSALVSGTSSVGRATPAPFARLTARVRPPAYTGAREATIESPVSIASLVGSAVTLRAPGSGTDISAEVAGRPVAVQNAGGEWRVDLTMTDRPAVVRLRHSSGERMVALEPRPDSAPIVRLTRPARDTVLRAAEGNVPLAAEVRDDIGLVSGGFEYIVSSGEGESFQFRSGTLGAKRFAADGDRIRSGTLAGVLELGSLGLKAGDIVHLRAIARDGNTVSGTGVGSSETRVLRIARASEYDSIAVEGAAPPEADRSLISQRMLIMMTEALERRRPRLARETVLSESRGIGRDQTRLRKRVGDIIFARLGDDPTGEHVHGPDEEPHDEPVPSPADSSADSARAALLRAAEAATTGGDEILDFEGDETPIVAINRPLLEAYNAMWEAGRELDQGEPARALPPMRRALAAIQRARQAERIYLRGKPPAVVVDLARVRLTGKDSGGPSTRSARAPADPDAARRAQRLAVAMTLVASEPAAAIDSLVLLRVETLDAAPALAAALGDAIEALRNGRDATPLFARARRVAEGTVRAEAGLSPWSGVW
jgi:hypothetical protein